MAHSTVWGLDIGNSAVKAVKMVRSGKEAEIVDFDIVDVHGGDEQGGRVQRVQEALKTLCNNHKIGNDAVYLSLPGDLCLFREFQIPSGSESKINDLVMYEAKQQIPFPPDQVEMGWEKYTDTQGQTGVELIVAKKTIINETLNVTKEQRLNVQGISVSPIALFNFIHFEYKPSGPTLILDAGYKGTDFVVMNDRHIYSRTIPIAGREITRALESRLKMDYDKAEEVKKNLESHKQADKIRAVLEPTLRQLGAEVQRTVGFYKSKVKGAKLTQAYLLGHTFRLPKMADGLAAQVREAPFTMVENMHRIRLARELNPQVFANEFPTMAVAIGLGLQGLGLSELKINLLPKGEKTDIILDKKKWWAAASAAAIVATCLVCYTQQTKEKAKLGELKENLEKVVKSADTSKDEIKKVTDPLPAYRERLVRYIRAGRDRGRLLKIFSAISSLKGDGGKPFFSDETKMYLTNLYVSRVPFTAEVEGTLKGALSNDRREMLKTSGGLAGDKSMYSGFKGVKISTNIPMDMRPDIPINVVVSGECDKESDVNQLVAALKKFPEVEEVYADKRKQLSPRVQNQPSYDEKGAILAEEPTGHGKVLEKQPWAFHMVVHWNPKDEPDLTVEAAALPAETKPGTPAKAPAGAPNKS